MFDEYISVYGKRLFGLCLKLTGSKETAEDLYQESWLKAYKSFDKFDRTKDFEPWLTTICVNLFRDMLRRNKWRRFFKSFQTNEEKDAAIEDIAYEQKDFGYVKQAVEKLPDKYRLAVVLFYFYDYDIKKTAEILNIPSGTAKYRLHTARELLRKELQDG